MLRLCLVARVLDQLALGRPHRQEHRPRLLPRGRVADGQPELEPVLADARVALGEVQTGR